MNKSFLIRFAMFTVAYMDELSVFLFVTVNQHVVEYSIDCWTSGVSIFMSVRSSMNLL